jgi:hypothetical protein
MMLSYLAISIVVQVSRKIILERSAVITPHTGFDAHAEDMTRRATVDDYNSH